MYKSIKIAAIVATTLLAVPAFAGGHLSGGIKEMKTSAGQVLAAENGMTLYTFDKDSAGKSNCNGGCAAGWPPLMAGSYAKDHEKLTVISRDDGSKQWAYKGAPLYFWQGDKKPGDITGNGMKKVWHIATP